MVTAWRLPLGMIEMAAVKAPPWTVASMRPLVMRPTRLPEMLRVDSVQLPVSRLLVRDTRVLSARGAVGRGVEVVHQCAGSEGCRLESALPRVIARCLN